MTNKEKRKVIMTMMQPDVDQYITIYMTLLIYLSYVNFNFIPQVVLLSILTMSLSKFIFGNTYKRDNKSLKRRKLVKKINAELSLNKYKLLIPLTLVVVGSINPIANFIAVTISSFAFSILIINATTNALGKLKYKLTLNKSDTYYNRPTLFKKGYLYKLLFGYNAVYITIEVDTFDTLDSLIPIDECDMVLHTDVAILDLLSESLKDSPHYHNTDLDNAMVEYNKSRRKSS